MCLWLKIDVIISQIVLHGESVPLIPASNKRDVGPDVYRI